MTDRTRLVVATPCFGGLCTTAYTHSLLLLQQACRTSDIDLQWFLGAGDALITRVRADLMTAFLDDAAATHLLYIDADIGFEPAQVMRLLKFDSDVTAAVYPAKALDLEMLRRALAENRRSPEAAALNYVFGFDAGKPIESRDGFAKVRHVGNGFLMIRRAALLKLCEAHTELRYSKVHLRNDGRVDSPHRVALFDTMIDRDTGEYLSEDYAFCRRWRDIGGEIWIDMQSKLTHVGTTAYAGDLGAKFDRAPAARRA